MIEDKMTHLLLWKKAENGLYAHVYEHIAAHAIDIYMQKSGQYFVADYDLFGSTYGTTCFLEATFYTYTARQTYMKALDNFQDSNISLEEIRMAAMQCGIEYGKSLEYINENLAGVIDALHHNEWVDISDFTAEQAVESTSVNTLFSTREVSYSTQSKGALNDITLEYILDKSYCTDPAHKALGVIIVQALALNFYRHLAKDHIYYDTGDEWDEGAAQVGYRSYIRLPQDTTLGASILTNKFAEFKSQNTGNMANAIKRLIGYSYANDHTAVYFGQKSLNQILGGVVIGGKGWEGVTTTTIQKIIDAVDLSAY